jgi:hypothetical protein
MTKEYLLSHFQQQQLICIKWTQNYKNTSKDLMIQLVKRIPQIKFWRRPWYDTVIKELNHLSYYCAKKLQMETGKPYRKPFGDPLEWYDLPYEEAPPTRLLSMRLILCYWLGFHDADKGHDLQKEEEGNIGAWDMIDKAYKSGLEE